MKVVFYSHELSGNVPVRDYLNSFNLEKDEKLILKILKSIEEVKKMNGIPRLPLSRKITNYSFCEIRIKKGAKKLIRIPYFCYNQEIILLHVFEKPEGDYKGKEERGIIKEYDVAEDYHNKFINNPKSYEEFKFPN